VKRAGESVEIPVNDSVLEECLIFPYLRKLLGDAWVDAEVLGDNATHLLGLWQRKNPNNPWVKYTEELARAIITSERIKFEPGVGASV
jgi:hypothetical protein